MIRRTVRTRNPRRKWIMCDATIDIGKTVRGSFTFLMRFELFRITFMDSVVVPVKNVHARIPVNR